MALIDMHVHSKYSEHPSEWFLQKLGAAESYTEPEFIYNHLKVKGMDFVTITDHNKIGGILELRKKHPHDTFMGVETTTYFPEDRCKIHILIYNFTEEQFSEIERLRENIYHLRDFIRREGLAYSVAHATFPVNNSQLKMEHLEKLVLLFDIFESVNGGRNFNNNHIWTDYLKTLRPDDIKRLQEKYKIEPFSEESWIKGFTGGSDDHAGLFLGMTYTNAPGTTLQEFFESLAHKQGIGLGQNNNFQGLAFTIYKIACEYFNTKAGKNRNTAFSIFAESFFGAAGLKESFIKRKLKYFAGKRKDIFQHLIQLIDNAKEYSDKNIDVRFEVAYNDISNIMDELIKEFLESLEEKMKEGEVFEIFNKITSMLPWLFLTVPFFTSMGFTHNSKQLLDQLKTTGHKKKQKKILWITDTISDLNGVAETLKKIGWVAARSGRELVIASSLKSEDEVPNLPPNYVNLPFLYSFSLPYYSTLKSYIPSVMKALKIIEEIGPDEIFISTPGPVGLLGLLAAKLLSIKTTGIYHTDFTCQLKNITDDMNVANWAENYTRWFYARLNEIRVPSSTYINMLENRGFDQKKMKLFKRGIDGKVFAPTQKDPELIRKKYGLGKGDILLFAGRVSKDKNLDFLLRIFKNINSGNRKINLIIAGDGPYLIEMKTKYSQEKNLHFTGQLDRNVLPELYSLADVFVFPSNTDTFGMVVLEAQACGLPAVVSDQGGPGEIIVNERTGYALPTVNEPDWINKIDYYLKMKDKNREGYNKLRHDIRIYTLANANWEIVLDDLFKGDC